MMKFRDFYFQVLIVFVSWKLRVNSGQSERPRGVSLSNGPLYSDADYFTCLDGSLTIPKSKVNDDYCDCKDGTDEPGTSACPSGQFHCSNRGFRPMYIPSSRVNDGICDCCDTSDEYDSPTRSLCVNTCKELGRAELMAKNEEAVIMNEGFEIRKGYIKTGLDTKVQRQQTLDKLKEELEQMEQLKDEKEELKDQAEKPEQEAINKHKAAWTEEKSRRDFILQTEKATAAFAELDQDSDGRVTFEEILLHPELDPDDTNEFTPQEAVSVLDENAEVEVNTFIGKVWKNIKDSYSSTPKTTEPPGDPQPPAPVEEPPEKRDDEPDADDDDEKDDEDLEDIEEDAAFEDEDYDYDDEDYDDEEDDEEDIRKFNEIKEKRRKKEEDEKDDDEDMPEYDEYTKSLIQIADEARAEYKDVNDKMESIKKNISQLERDMSVDLGPEQEFLPLQGQCYEYTDREYTYKLCMFEKATQRPKAGGSETSLGKWGEWTGSNEKKYSEMTYAGGLKCWNGPDRSCVVKLQCGKENQLTGASEPERCVYEFTMTTPSLCNKKIDLTSGNIDEHDEL